MTTHAETLAQLRAFIAERDWARFHTPANLAKSISIEAAELLEHFQWSEDDADLAEVQDELADVLTYAFMFADHMGWDVDGIVQAKLEKTKVKHPAPASADTRDVPAGAAEATTS